jgi:hypothetical protein
MTRNVIPAKSPKATKKPKSKTNKSGNAKKPARKSAGAPSLITSRDVIMDMPVREVAASLPKFDLDKTTDYDMKVHTPKSGQHAGEEQWDFYLTTPDGKKHRIWQGLACAIDAAFTADPLLRLQFAAYVRDNPHAQ